MRKFLRFIPFIIVIIAVLSLDFTSLEVREKESGVPIGGARVNYFFTNSQGSVSFLDTVFTRKLRISRIGFRASLVRVPLSPLFRNLGIVELELSSFDEICEQLYNWANSLTVYGYKLSTESPGGKIVISAKRKENDFEFEFLDSSTENSYYRVLNIGNKMFLETYEGVLRGPLTEEEKEDLFTQYISFIDLGDVLCEFFHEDDPQVKALPGGALELSYEDGVTFIFFDESGLPARVIMNKMPQSGSTFAVLEVLTDGIIIQENEN